MHSDASTPFKGPFCETQRLNIGHHSTQPLPHAFKATGFLGMQLCVLRNTHQMQKDTEGTDQGRDMQSYLEVSQAAPGVFQGAVSRGLVRLAGYPRCLVCVNAISAFLLALFESCIFSLPVSDSIHPKKQQHSILVICKQTTDLVL